MNIVKIDGKEHVAGIASHNHTVHKKTDENQTEDDPHAEAVVSKMNSIWK